MEFYYVNSKNEKLDFTKFPYLAKDISELLNYGHRYKCNGNKISEFYDSVSEIPFSVNVYADTKEEYQDAANRFFEVTEYDFVSGNKGRLYYNGQYVECNLISNKKDDWYEEIGFHVAYVNMVTDHPVWITEDSKQFYPGHKEAEGGLDFPFDFPFDFTSNEKRSERWNVDHLTSSHYKMTIYGPCVNPRILVNGYPIQVFTELEANEYMVIESRKHTVTKYLANGTTENAYNSRQFEPSIFEKIPSGLLTFDWNGAFGFDLTLYLERSEPKW